MQLNNSNIAKAINISNSKIKEYTNQDINKNSMFVNTIVASATNTQKALSINFIKNQDINKNLTFHEIVNGKFKQENSNQYLYQYIKNCLNINSISTIATKNIKKKGTILKFQSIVGYNFNNQNLKYRADNTNKLIANLPNINGQQSTFASVFIKESFQLLNIFFKSIYCLISKPVFKYTQDRLIIELFYYLTIPRKKVFKIFSIINIASFKKKWLINNSALNNANKVKNLTLNNRLNKPRPLFVRWKLRRAISRFRSKNINIRNLLFEIRKFAIVKVFNYKFKLICDILSNIFNKPVTLNITRLHSPYYDSNILVNLLSLNIKNKRKKSRVAILKIYSKNKKKVKLLNDPNLNTFNGIPAFLSGINIKINGRLMREPNIPRLTTKVFENGAIATGKVNYLDTANIINKNKKGAYNIKITNAQNFYF